MGSTVEYLKRAIKDTPLQDATSPPEVLEGWDVGPEQCSVCAACASSLLRRGHRLPIPVNPVWFDGLAKSYSRRICCLCGQQFRPP